MPGEDDGNLFVQDEALYAVMFQEGFIPSGQCIVLSPNIDAPAEWLPEEVSEFLTDFDVRIISYTDPNTQTFPLFVKDDIIDVGEQGERDAIPRTCRASGSLWTTIRSSARGHRPARSDRVGSRHGRPGRSRLWDQ